MPTPKDLVNDARKAVYEARSRQEAAEAKGELTPDLDKQVNDLLDEYDRLAAQAESATQTKSRLQERLGAYAAMEAALAAPDARAELPPALDPAAPGSLTSATVGALKSGTMPRSWAKLATAGDLPPAATPAQVKAFGRHITSGLRNLSAADVASLQELQTKAWNVTSDPDGGYIVAPQQFMATLVSIIDDLTFIRDLATVIPMVRAESLGVPTLDTQLNDADWTSELLTGSEDTVSLFGRRELKPSPIAKLVRLSKKLIRQAAIAPEAILMERMAYKFAITQEKGFLTGSGQNQPLGVFTASALGIPTTQDTACASTSVFTADELINLKHALKLQYWNKAVWILHRDVLKMARKLKDGNNNYVWATGLGPGGGFQGNASLLLELPYKVSEYAPNTFTTGKYMTVLGDFSKYYIAEALTFQVQVLVERYAELDMNGYIGRAELDGMPVIAEAFVRLALA